MTRPLVVVRGDGVGPEVVDAAIAAASPLLDGFELVDARMGLTCYRETGSALPADTLKIIQDGGLALLGAVQTPPNAQYSSPLLRTR
ncbi:MAG: isocitrate/isopropylmalate family dehydrogenase, partial [Methanopyri archaeon]|nr:isocitrate/isopropylmalate family dehydrogenase [Methanopyri archaeon]